MWRRGGDGEGRTSSARSNDGDAWHTNRTAPTTVILTLAADTSPHTSPQNIISRNVTRQLHREREMSRPCSTRHLGAHAPSARRCGRRRRVIGPIPFRRHPTPIPTKTSPQSPSVTSSPQQPPDMTLPCRLPFVQASGSTRPTTRN